MKSLGRLKESDHAACIVASSISVELDYSKVRTYWKQATPLILGPYMTDGFGFPASGGRSELATP